MKIAVAGTGYVGLVTGVCLASKGHGVTCVDVDENKVKIMKNGDSPIYEPGLSELMKEHKNSLVFTTDYEEAYREAEVIFIGVQERQRSKMGLQIYHMSLKLQSKLHKQFKEIAWL